MQQLTAYLDKDYKLLKKEKQSKDHTHYSTVEHPSRYRLPKKQHFAFNFEFYPAYSSSIFLLIPVILHFKNPNPNAAVGNRNGAGRFSTIANAFFPLSLSCLLGSLLRSIARRHLPASM